LARSYEKDAVAPAFAVRYCRFPSMSTFTFDWRLQSMTAVVTYRTRPVRFSRAT
jgi:hypothetical protein